MKYLLLSLATVFLLASCSKPSDTKSREDMLRNGKWRVSGGTEKYKNINGHDTTVSILSMLQDCQKDNYMVFGQNYTGYANYGSNKCSPSEPDQTTFNWYLDDSKNNITFTNADALFGKTTLSTNFIDFSEGSFTLKYYFVVHIDPTNTDDTTTITETFSKF